MIIPTPILTGLVGLLLGVANFIGFRTLAAKLAETGAPAATSGKRRLLMSLAWFDLVAFPVVGYFIPTIFKGL